MDGIDLDGATPLYRQVADLLETRIADGLYPPGRRVPSSRDLADEFRVSRRTVVAALDILREKGIVHGVQGRGTFVAEPDKSGE